MHVYGTFNIWGAQCPRPVPPLIIMPMRGCMECAARRLCIYLRYWPVRNTFFSPAGFSSIRDRVSGTWFIQAICEQLIARAHLDDLDTMMEKVYIW